MQKTDTVTLAEVHVGDQGWKLCAMPGMMRYMVMHQHHPDMAWTLMKSGTSLSEIMTTFLNEQAVAIQTTPWHALSRAA